MFKCSALPNIKLLFVKPIKKVVECKMVDNGARERHSWKLETDKHFLCEQRLMKYFSSLQVLHLSRERESSPHGSSLKVFLDSPEKSSPH